MAIFVPNLALLIEMISKNSDDFEFFMFKCIFFSHFLMYFYVVFSDPGACRKQVNLLSIE